jgi:signal transduction histidine kinase
MLSCWPIRHKLQFALALLLVTVGILSFSSFRGAYSYRGLARGISTRAAELPLTTELARHVSDLRDALDSATSTQSLLCSPLSVADDIRKMSARDFHLEFSRVQDTLQRYRDALVKNKQLAVATGADLNVANITDVRGEWEAVLDIDAVIKRIENLCESDSWVLNEAVVEQLDVELNELHKLSAALPSYLQKRMQQFAMEVRLQYRTWIILTWVTTISAVPLLILLGYCLYKWIFRPLRTILHGSRHVAAGQFDHRIQLASQDEIGELANAMNNMTQRFQEIRDDLDEQVRQRTKEVVRSEQMASVGFLAAGVSHEINNPLASIALCAESLEDRLQDIIQEDDLLPDDEHNTEIEVLRNYLRMIQDEAFRCKQITQQLLDFSRLGDVEKQPTDMTTLVRDVIEMVGHIGRYKEKEIQFDGTDSVYAAVNPQELKQVVLNLLTNALDSLNGGGMVNVRLQRDRDIAVLVVSDNGCGMTEDVKKHLFEPFFTRRRDGQGTGLGMSITYRIVSDHGGTIDAYSDGPGHGSRVTVRLPSGLDSVAKEHEYRYQTQAA